MKFRQFSGKQISRKIDRYSTVDPIELIEATIELLKPSLPSEHIDKKKTLRKIVTGEEVVEGYPQVNPGPVR